MINRFSYALKTAYHSFKTAYKDINYFNWLNLHRNNLFKYRNIHLGEDCFIIGNGPSINEMNLSLLNDYFVFGLNKIHLILEKQKINFNYHVAINKLVISQIQQELESNILNCTSFISYNASHDIKNISHLERLYTDRQPWSFYEDISNNVSEGYTVTYVAMQIAFYMGFKRIFLVGVDHNFNQTGLPNEEQLYQGDDINHFHPDYFKGKKWHLADINANEVSYKMADYFFKKKNREIFDCTLNGKLNIFPKLSFDTALDLARKKFI